MLAVTEAVEVQRRRFWAERSKVAYGVLCDAAQLYVIAQLLRAGRHVS